MDVHDLRPTVKPSELGADAAFATRTVLVGSRNLGPPIALTPMHQTDADIFLEPLAMLWIELAYAQRFGPNIGFVLLRMKHQSELSKWRPECHFGRSIVSEGSG
jgi:hypothetical protein